LNKLLTKTIELLKFVFINIFAISIWMLIWQKIPWLGIALVTIFAPLFLYGGYKFFKDIHQSNLDDIQEQLNIVQDSWIEDISNKVRENWDLKSKKVVPYDRWNCRIYIQQDEDGNVLETEIQECSITEKRRASRIKKSLEKAVLNTSPLPHPEDESVFTRQIYFDFSKT
jgi:hypothetical protein